MLKSLLNKMVAGPVPSLGLTLEGEQVSWMEVDTARSRVLNHGASSWLEFIHSRSLRGRSVRTLVHGRDTYYGLVEQDVLDTTQLDRQIPFPKGSYQLRTFEVPSLSRPGQRAHFFAAALSAPIESLRQRFTRQGLILEGVEVPATAMVREFVVNRGASSHPVMLLHVGDELTHLVILNGEHPYLARDFPVGFRQFAYHWQMGKRCSEEEARKEIRLSDCCQEGPLEPIVSGFLTELVRTARSFPAPVREIYLSGNGVLPGLDVRLARETGLATVIDESQSVQWRKSVADSHRFKLPLGLAL